MASNLQLVFYRSSRTPEILVKVLYNGRESSLPIPQVIIAEQMYRLYHFDMYHLQHIQMYHLRSGRFKVLQSYYFLSVFLLIESPFNSMRLALARSLSRMASASVGSDM